MFMVMLDDSNEKYWESYLNIRGMGRIMVFVVHCKFLGWLNKYVIAGTCSTHDETHVTTNLLIVSYF